jgi:hypothetical protein
VREGEAGPCGTDGPKGGAGPCGEHGPHAREGKEKGRRVLFGLEEGRWAARERKEKEGKKRGGPAGGWAARAGKKGKGRGKRGRGLGSFLLLFSNLFKLIFFKLLKLNSFSNSKFKLSLSFQTFKTF